MIPFEQLFIGQRHCVPGYHARNSLSFPHWAKSVTSKKETLSNNKSCIQLKSNAIMEVFEEDGWRVWHCLKSLRRGPPVWISTPPFSWKIQEPRSLANIVCAGCDEKEKVRAGWVYLLFKDLQCAGWVYLQLLNGCFLQKDKYTFWTLKLNSSNFVSFQETRRLHCIAWKETTGRVFIEMRRGWLKVVERHKTAFFKVFKTKYKICVPWKIRKNSFWEILELGKPPKNITGFIKDFVLNSGPHPRTAHV